MYLSDGVTDSSRAARLRAQWTEQLVCSLTCLPDRLLASLKQTNHEGADLLYIYIYLHFFVRLSNSGWTIFILRFAIVCFCFCLGKLKNLCGSELHVTPPITRGWRRCGRRTLLGYRRPWLKLVEVFFVRRKVSAADLIILRLFSLTRIPVAYQVDFRNSKKIKSSQKFTSLRVSFLNAGLAIPKELVPKWSNIYRFILKSILT